MNVFTFTGNLGKDCEIKSTQSGMTICSFSVAVQSGYGDKEKTTWVRCNLFGKRAEGTLPQYLLTGSKVAISGELSMNEWQDQQGATQKMLSVAVDKLDLVGSRPDSAAQPQQAPQQRQQAPQQQVPQMQQQPYQQPQHQQNGGPVAQGGYQQPAPNFDDDIPGF